MLIYLKRQYDTGLRLQVKIKISNRDATQISIFTLSGFFLPLRLSKLIFVNLTLIAALFKIF